MSLKGKSGQGTQSTYIPTWELYDLCDSFLHEAVIPRKYVDHFSFFNYNNIRKAILQINHYRTTSNYIKKIMPAPASNEITIHPPTVFEITAPPNVKAPLNVITTASQISTAKWTPDFYASLSSMY